MVFTFLTDAEVKGSVIHWDKHASKSAELVAAAIGAGFSDWEVRESALGVLEQDFLVSKDWLFKRGARALIGMNGSTLLEVL